MSRFLVLLLVLTILSPLSLVYAENNRDSTFAGVNSPEQIIIHRSESLEIPITIQNSIKNKKFDCSNGLQLRDFTYVDDVVAAIIKTLKNEDSLGQIINIGQGKPLLVKDVINKIC